MINKIFNISVLKKKLLAIKTAIVEFFCTLVEVEYYYIRNSFPVYVAIKNPAELYYYNVKVKKIFNAYSIFFNQIVLNFLILFLFLFCLANIVFLWKTVFIGIGIISFIKMLLFFVSKTYFLSIVLLLLFFHIISHLRNIFNDYTKTISSRRLLNVWSFFFFCLIYIIICL